MDDPVNGAQPEGEFWTRENLEAWDVWLSGVLEILTPMANAPVDRLAETVGRHPQGLKDLLERCEIAVNQFKGVIACSSML